MSDCKFCNGEPRQADELSGGGIKTMGMMIDMLFGSRTERDYAYNGIQLKNGNLLCFDNSACEYTVLGIRVNYCPFCGKELKEKSEGDNNG